MVELTQSSFVDVAMGVVYALMFATFSLGAYVVAREALGCPVGDTIF